MPDPVQPREGEVAFAISVGTLYDLTIGRIGWPVRFTRHSHPTLATLTLANRTPGGPILDIVELPVVPGDPVRTILRVTKGGIEKANVGYLDLLYQDPLPDGPGIPDAPGLGTETLRMYARGGQLFFKAENSGEWQIPIGAPPGPNLHLTAWLAGG